MSKVSPEMSVCNRSQMIAGFDSLSSTTYPTTFTEDTGSLEWANFLKSLPLNNIQHICPQLVCYKNGAEKSKAIKKALADACSNSPDPSNPDPSLPTFQSTILDYHLPTTVPAAASGFRAGGSLAIIVNRAFSNPETNKQITEALTNGEDPVTAWHAYATLYKKGVLGIYDPSFDDYWEKEKDMRYLILGKELKKALIKNASPVNEVWVGGGGNYDGLCQEMTRAWVYKEVVEKRGEDLWDWEGLGWKKMK